MADVNCNEGDIRISGELL